MGGLDPHERLLKALPLKSLMNPPPLCWTAAFLIGFLAAGCGPSPGDYGYDNPNIRAIQREHSMSVIPSKDKQIALAHQCGKKVFFVTSGDSRKMRSSGRAAAITSDGYFLTANHVVSRNQFFLSEVTLTAEQNKELNRSGFLLQKRGPERDLPGRLVWHDEGADLAVIKFDLKTPHFFNQLKFPAPVGEVVYSSDDLGQISLPKDKVDGRLQDHAIGNGPYFSAGRVLFSQLFTHGPGVHTIGSTLVARGGMSGGPLVTLEGELCGILTNVGFYRFKKDNEVRVSVRSTSRMLPPQVLRDIIAKDRAKSRALTTTAVSPEVLEGRRIALRQNSHIRFSQD